MLVWPTRSAMLAMHVWRGFGCVLAAWLRLVAFGYSCAAWLCQCVTVIGYMLGCGRELVLSEVERVKRANNRTSS